MNEDELFIPAEAAKLILIIFIRGKCMRRFFFLGLSVFVCGVILASCGTSDDTGGQKDADGKLSRESSAACLQTIQNKCTSCHYITRICQALDKKGKGGWKSTVKSMVKKGAKLSKEGQQTMVQCLLEPGVELSGVCEQYR